MKVLHIGLGCHYSEGMLYQDNVLSDINAKSGHTVVYVSDTYCFKNGTLVEVDSIAKILPNGVRLIRIKYDRLINDFVTQKIKKARLLKRIMNEFRPDTILYHNICGYELIDVAQYAKKRNIPLYIDTHENFKNTAKTPIAKFAYKYIHGFFVKKAVPVAKKILYVGYDEKMFLDEMYHIPESKTELFSLGGILLDEGKQEIYREKVINEMGFPQDTVICAHSGKMDSGKKTEEVLRAFSKVKDNRLRLLIFGSISSDIREIIEPLIDADERIIFLGWKTAQEQEYILGATDLYLQPGTCSATAQIALCAGCALLVSEDYRQLMEDAAFYEDTANGITKVLNLIINDEEVLKNMKSKGKRIAENKFDYYKIADRYLR